MILGLALWMYIRTRREVAEAAAHGHAEGDAPAASKLEMEIELPLPVGLAAPARLMPRVAPRSLMLDTGHGWLKVAIEQVGGAARFRIYPCRASGALVPVPKGTTMGLETARLDGMTQRFVFEVQGDCWQATAVIPEPHTFLAVVSMGHGDHAHTYRLRFNAEVAGQGSSPAAAVVQEPEEGGVEYQDAHERAHAQDIARRFSNRAVTTPQIILFGITGGLMPCPAAFTILLVCLQIKRAALGFAFVGAFSFGLALTMVSVGVIAAWSVQHAQKRFGGFGDWMRRAPYISCALLVLLAGFMAWQGWLGLHGHAAMHSH
jgi:nickel/cobalt exporter